MHVAVAGATGSHSHLDGARPEPPYHLLSRVVAVKDARDDPADGELEPGSGVIAEYDVPDAAWYFEQDVMPVAVLLEIALQSCGWLASCLGSEVGPVFRDLDCAAVVTGEVTPATRIVRTLAEITSVSRGGDMVVESFTVRCVADGLAVFALSAVIGALPDAAFEDQPGLAASREWLGAPSDRMIDPARHRDGPIRLPGPALSVLDRITGYWPEAGAAGLGRLRAETDVARFLRDSVQPGSLGVEAVCQLLQLYVIERGLTRGIPHPRFETAALGTEISWRYRGRLTPANRLIRVEAEVLEVVEGASGREVVAEAKLWVDDTCVCHVRRIGVRVVAGEGPPAVVESVLDPAVDTWLADHCPTWTVPTAPMMSIVDIMARAAAEYSGLDVLAVRDVRLRRWVLVPEPLRTRTEVEELDGGFAVRLLVWRESWFEEVATATVVVGSRWRASPERFAAPPDAVPQPDPYGTAALFHGPAFQYLTEWKVGSTGSCAVLDAARGTVPRGCLNQGLLDAAVQVIPHANLAKWAPEIGRGTVGFPWRVDSLEIFAELPGTGEVEVVARFAGFDDEDGLFPVADVQLCAAGRVLAAFRLVAILLPLGGTAAPSPAVWRDFLRERKVNGMALSTTTDGITRLSVADIATVDWLPGTVAHGWNLTAPGRAADHAEVLAVKDHVGRIARVHPSTVDVSEDLRSASVDSRRFYVHVTRVRDKVIVRSVSTS
ncbi:polyketide synthase dehydratase domain-containing protein [Allokutzneria sp. A3M-2-11 16]|uniref:polyketide synthase dehydratase domain-containing protein n=1 Tax=Allokutzneria sp. A3M-2-11 16 TaxID=2962043 RepID=UPI0020B6F2A8|nr:polyketide synthase dehydratase domain-containing protein [Allokutzneria sp. A3M-2-11 16]MCP3804840.1 polyketide synthase dehydratase domain-containing protein [Allokutzneria sp. A3M-2-11 16]